MRSERFTLLDNINKGSSQLHGEDLEAPGIGLGELAYVVILVVVALEVLLLAEKEDSRSRAEFKIPTLSQIENMPARQADGQGVAPEDVGHDIALCGERHVVGGRKGRYSYVFARKRTSVEPVAELGLDYQELGVQAIGLVMPEHRQRHRGALAGNHFHSQVWRKGCQIQGVRFYGKPLGSPLLRESQQQEEPKGHCHNKATLMRL